MTFPARQYSANGERRSFALLRPANGDASVSGRDSAMHPLVVGILTSVPDAIITKAYAPILITGTVFGAIAG